MSVPPKRRRSLFRRVYRSALLPGAIAMLVLALLAFVGLRALDQVGSQTTLIVSHNLEATARIAGITARTRALNGDVYRLLALRAARLGPPRVTDAIDGLIAQTAQLIADLGQYRDRFANAEQAITLNRAIDELTHYQHALRSVGDQLSSDFAGALGFIEPYNALLDNLAALLSRMTDATVQDAQRVNALATDTTRHTGRYLLGMTLIIAGSISLLAWRFGKRQQSILLTTHALETEVEARTADLNTARIQAETALAEVRRTQKALVDAEQMAALGSLVAGVAHEINTPVGTSLTAATLLEDRTRQFRDLVTANQVKKTDLTRYLDLASETTGLMLSNINRAANLIQSFKQVAVDQTSAERRPFDLATYLSEVITSLTPQLRKTAARVQLDCPAGIDMDSYPGALSQVVTNLLMNALTHAFADGRAGTITVHAEPANGERVRIDFADSGSGIPPENLARIFEPFFTTKRGAGGTGLGLHIVYNIVTQQLGGDINVESTVGQGTRFIVTMPLRASA